MPPYGRGGHVAAGHVSSTTVERTHPVLKPNVCRWDDCRTELPTARHRFCEAHRKEGRRARWREAYAKRDKTRMAALRSASRARARDRDEDE